MSISLKKELPKRSASAVREVSNSRPAIGSSRRHALQEHRQLTGRQAGGVVDQGSARSIRRRG